VIHLLRLSQSTLIHFLSFCHQKTFKNIFFLDRMATHLWRCHSPIHHNRIFCRTKRHPVQAEIRFPSETASMWITSVRPKTSAGKIELRLEVAAAVQPPVASVRLTSRTGRTSFRRRRTSRRLRRAIHRRILREVSSKIDNRQL